MKKRFLHILVGLFLSAFLVSNTVYAQNSSVSASAMTDDPMVNMQKSSTIDILDLKNMDVHDVLKLISRKTNLNIVSSPQVSGRVSIYLKDVDVLDALKIIARANGWAYVRDGEIITVMTAAEYQAEFSEPFGMQTQTKIVYLQHTNASEIMPVLEQIKSASGKIILSTKSNSLIIMDSKSKIDQLDAIIASIDKPRKTEYIDLSYADVEVLSQKIAETLTPEFGEMRTDVRSNSLIVSDTQAKMDKIGQIVDRFDRKDKEVLVEAKIIQITLSDDLKLGVDWEAIVSEFHNLNINKDFGILSTTDKGARLSVGTLTDDEYTATIEALQIIGKTKILSNPSIAAVNNKEAKILIGSTEPYVTTTTTTPASGPTTTAESINFIDVGVKLYVTPTIHNDDFITMNIKPEVSSVTRNLTTSNNNTIPIVETTEAETVVTVKNGITIVIGGLIKNENISEIKQVPLLGSIPILGRFLRSESDEETVNEIAIFLTPTIITGDATQRAGFRDSTFFPEKFDW